MASATQAVVQGETTSCTHDWETYGRWWLVDSGHYTSEPGPIRDFLSSPQAHHTYIRGEQGLRYDEKPDLDVVLTGLSSKNGVWQVSGRSDRFLDGASFERTLAIDEATGEISVRDSCNQPAGTGQLWRGWLRLAPDLEVMLDGRALIATDPASGRALRIAIEGAEGLPIVAGEENPLQGWVVQERELREAPVLEFETDGLRGVTMEITWH